MNNIEKVTLVSASVAIVFLGKKLFEESKAFYKIQKTLSTKNIEIQYLPLSVVEKTSTRSNQEKLNPKYINPIVNYYNKIKNEMPHADLTIYNKNIKSLQIDEVDKLKKKNSGGNYNVAYNKITKLKKEKAKVLNHELLHMSSGFLIGNSCFIGFSQYDYDKSSKSFGDGINEGYTTLLDERYFDGYNYSDTYYILNIVAYIIELIIGQEKMEKLYFSADLHNLIESLKEYNSKSNIIKFLNNTDVLLCCSSNTATEKHYRKKALNNISDFLIKTYTSKQLNLFYNKKINKEILEKRILKLIDVLDELIEINGKLYKFSNISSVYENVSKLSHTPVEEIKLKRKVYEKNSYN